MTPEQEFVLNSARFRREREASWRRLEDLLERVEAGGIAKLSHDELIELPILYRGAVGSLSVARAISLDRNLLVYLEHLAVRAHLVVYAGQRRPLAALRDFVTSRFPRIVRGFRAAFAVALLSLVAGIVCGYAMTAHDPERFHSFVSPQMAQGRTPEAPTDSLRAALYGAPQRRDVLSLFVSFLFSNNAGVGIMCLAFGFAAGVPVVILLFDNGLGLGALAALYADRGLALAFWGWVLPHGITELLAVVLCGTSGLVFGASILFPGECGRLENLSRRGRAAALVVLGAVGMFFIAALIEGVFRQLVTNDAARWTLALITLAGWIAYFGGVGHERRDRRSSP